MGGDKTERYDWSMTWLTESNRSTNILQSRLSAQYLSGGFVAGWVFK